MQFNIESIYAEKKRMKFILFMAMFFSVFSARAETQLPLGACKTFLPQLVHFSYSYSLRGALYYFFTIGQLIFIFEKFKKFSEAR